MALRESLTFWKLVRGDWKSSLRKLITQGQMESHGCPGTVHHSLPAFTRRRCLVQCGETAGGRRQERLSVTAPSPLLQQVVLPCLLKLRLLWPISMNGSFVPIPGHCAVSSGILLPASPTGCTEPLSRAHVALGDRRSGKVLFLGGWSPFQTGDLRSAYTADLFIWLFCKKEIN